MTALPLPAVVISPPPTRNPPLVTVKAKVLLGAGLALTSICCCVPTWAPSLETVRVPSAVVATVTVAESETVTPPLNPTAKKVYDLVELGSVSGTRERSLFQLRREVAIRETALLLLRRDQNASRTLKQ